MKTEILNIDTGKAKELSVLDSIFSISPRKDVLNRVVRWQMARKQQGTHSVKTRSEGSYSNTVTETLQFLEKEECIKVQHREVMSTN